MKRQGLRVSIKELKDLIDTLEDEWDDFSLGESLDEDKCYQINIINKEGLSDTWRIENE